MLVFLSIQVEMTPLREERHHISGDYPPPPPDADRLVQNNTKAGF